MLELQHISWTAPGGNQVLRDVSLTIPEGEAHGDHRAQWRGKDHLGQDHRGH